MNRTITRNGRRTAAVAALAIFAASLLATGPTASAQVQLHNGQVRVISGGFHSTRWYRVEVPARATRLEVRMAAGIGNASLFLRSPTGLWRASVTPGNSEQIVVGNPQRGRWIVRVYGTGAYHNAALCAVYHVRRRPGWQQAAVHAAPGIINGIAQALANRHGDNDDDDDDDDDADDTDDAAPLAPATPAADVRMRTLRRGIWTTGLRGDSDDPDYYRIIVPRDARRLTFTTRGGHGCCWLLVRRDALPDGANHDRRSALAGTAQAVVFERPDPGVYYARVVGDPTFRGVALRAQFEEGRPEAETADLRITTLANRVGVGPLDAGPRSRRYYMIHFPIGPSRLVVTTRGGQGSCHLYIRRNALPTTQEFDFAGTQRGAAQTVLVENGLPAGTYYVMVCTDVGYRGVTLLADGAVPQAGAAEVPAPECNLAILTPAAEALRTGRTHEVTWRAPADVETVRLEVSWDAGQTYRHLATLPARTPRFSWYVPADQAFAGAVVLRISEDGNSANAAARTLSFRR